MQVMKFLNKLHRSHKGYRICRLFRSKRLLRVMEMTEGRLVIEATQARCYSAHRCYTDHKVYTGHRTYQDYRDSKIIAKILAIEGMPLIEASQNMQARQAIKAQ